MYDEICKLIPTTRTVTTAGDPVDVDGTAKIVFCRVKTYNAKEKYMAETVGIWPELVIVLADKLDYGGEDIVEYDSKRYEVVSVTYADTSDDIGLVVRRWQR